MHHVRKPRRQSGLSDLCFETLRVKFRQPMKSRSLKTQEIGILTGRYKGIASPDARFGGLRGMLVHRYSDKTRMEVKDIHISSVKPAARGTERTRHLAEVLLRAHVASGATAIGSAFNLESVVQERWCKMVSACRNQRCCQCHRGLTHTAAGE